MTQNSFKKNNGTNEFTIMYIYFVIFRKVSLENKKTL